MVGIVLVQVIDVDVVGAEPAQAVVAGLQHPAARQPAVVRLLRHHVAALGGEDPLAAMRLDGGADDALGRALGVDIRRVDEVEARVACLGDDVRRRRFVRAVAEHHRAEAQRRDGEAAVAESDVVHVSREGPLPSD
jgi:hypothetical protein